MKYFWSDLHFGEKEVCKVGKRGQIFSSQEEWEGRCIESLCSYLKAGDILYLLGDTATKQSMRNFRALLPKKIMTVLIVGNHDPSMGFCQTVFGQSFVKDYTKIKLRDNLTILSHYPILYWDKCHNGSLHLHGHVHDQKTDLILSLFPEARILDVCPESSLRWLGEFRPFSEDDVCEILLKRKGHDDVSMYPKYD